MGLKNLIANYVDPTRIAPTPRTSDTRRPLPFTVVIFSGKAFQLSGKGVCLSVEVEDDNNHSG